MTYGLAIPLGERVAVLADTAVTHHESRGFFDGPSSFGESPHRDGELVVSERSFKVRAVGRGLATLTAEDSALALRFLAKLDAELNRGLDVAAAHRSAAGQMGRFAGDAFETLWAGPDDAGIGVWNFVAKGSALARHPMTTILGVGCAPHGDFLVLAHLMQILAGPWKLPDAHRFALAAAMLQWRGTSTGLARGFGGAYAGASIDARGRIAWMPDTRYVVVDGDDFWTHGEWVDSPFARHTASAAAPARSIPPSVVLRIRGGTLCADSSYTNQVRIFPCGELDADRWMRGHQANLRRAMRKREERFVCFLNLRFFSIVVVDRNRSPDRFMVLRSGPDARWALSPELVRELAWKPQSSEGFRLALLSEHGVRSTTVDGHRVTIDGKIHDMPPSLANAALSAEGP